MKKESLVREALRRPWALGRGGGWGVGEENGEFFFGFFFF